MKLELISFFVSLSLCSVKSLLVKPQEFCVPTHVVKGPCHKCICNADGVFVCHATVCPKTDVNPRKSNKDECQRHVTYRFEEMFCTCNYEGKWMSLNCRETFQYLRSEKTPAKNTLRSNLTITCTPASLFLIDCNICQCEKSGVIRPSSCTTRNCTTRGHKSDTCKFGDFLRTNDEICLCSDVNFFIDRLCVKVGEMNLQEIERHDIALITNISQIRKSMDKDTCVPQTEYKIDCNRCVCDKNGELVCTNKICDTKITALRIGDENVAFYNLAKAIHEKQDCEPGQKYRIKCNTCVCSNKRTLSCTTMVCLEDFIFATNKQIDHDDLPEIEDGQNCVPGRVYKVSCNTCQCGENNSLFCTRMACLENAVNKEFQDNIKPGKQNKHNTEKKMKEVKKLKKDVLRKGFHSSERSERVELDHKNFPPLPEGKCEPGRTYSNGCKKCFCNEKKIAKCTHACSSGLPNRFADKEITEMETRPAVDLPELPHMGAECEPGRTYTVVCNICFCSYKHDLYCTAKYCVNMETYADVLSKELTGRPCKKDFKMMCTSCKCVNMTNQCTPILNCGKNLTGKQLMTSAAGANVKLTYDVKKEKCKPRVSYKLHCNDCYCQSDRSLRCTQRVCLTYSQTKSLQDKQTYLEKHGR